MSLEKNSEEKCTDLNYILEVESTGFKHKLSREENHTKNNSYASNLGK